MKTLFLRLVAVAAPLLLASSVQAAGYNYSSITFPGAIGTYPVSINSLGTIAGYFFDSGYGAHGFTYENGVYTQIDGGAQCYGSFVTGINNSGVITGYCFANVGGTLSFIDTRGTLTFFKEPGALNTYSEAINDKNVSAGWYITGSGVIGGYVAVNGKVSKNLQAPGAAATAVYGINDSNQLVGNALLGASQAGLVYQSGVYTTYRYPGSYETFFNGINNAGLIVGDENKVARGPVTAFVFTNGAFTDLVVPNAVTSVASGINTAGVIVGYYTDASGTFYGFLATPQ